jgi:hypothetical protein
LRIVDSRATRCCLTADVGFNVSITWLSKLGEQRLTRSQRIRGHDMDLLI